MNEDQTYLLGVELIRTVDPQRVAREEAWLKRIMTNPWWIEYQVPLKEAQSGQVRIVRQEMTEARALAMNLVRRNVLEKGIRSYPGTWTYAVIGDEAWMSDTPEEISDHLAFIKAARGNVLVTGLGLGVVVQALLRKPEVERIDVVDLSPDMARLVGPTFEADPRFHLHTADAWAWNPPSGIKYDWAWHDIWRDLTTDNLPQFHRIRKRYAHVAKHQWCWGEEFLEELLTLRPSLERPGSAEEKRQAIRRLEALHALRQRGPDDF